MCGPYVASIRRKARSDRDQSVLSLLRDSRSAAKLTAEGRWLARSCTPSRSHSARSRRSSYMRAADLLVPLFTTWTFTIESMSSRTTVT